MSSRDTRTPTHIWLDAKVRELSSAGIGVYVTQKGEKMDGLVLLKLSSCMGQARLVTQQRNFETDELEWIDVLEGGIVEERQADDYVSRAIGRDPDLWVVEIEATEMINPFKV